MQVRDRVLESRDKERLRQCSALASRIGNLELDIQFLRSEAHQRFDQIEAIAHRSSSTARQLQTDTNASLVGSLLRATRAIGRSLSIRGRIEIAVDLANALRALASLDSGLRDAAADIENQNRQIAGLERRILASRREISAVRDKRSRLRCGQMR